MIKIYTKKGDKGETSLFSGDRVPKNNPFIEAVGTVDELNSTIGAALSFFPSSPEFKRTREELETVQHTLFDLGAAIATPRTRASEAKIEKTRFDQEGTEFLEKWIDRMEEELPSLNHFILPGGNSAGAMLHIARSLCRRAERKVVPLYQIADVPEVVLIYLNRLSDYLFVVSRYVNQLAHMPETAWIHHKKSVS